MQFLKRLKTLCTALFAAGMLFTGPVQAAGTLPLSLVQQSDINGQPLAGCLLYFYVAGTVASPQNAFADFGLTNPLPNPVQCDQTGRVPLFWLADGLIHVRLTDNAGGVILDVTMQVLGPSSGGGGGGGTVDPTTILATGDIKVKYGTGPLTGFVRANGRTIGSAASGATERANADTQALFIYLWGSDPNLVVSGGRGVSGLSDFTANKTIALPDGRGRVLSGLDDMGSSAAGRYTSATFGAGNATTLGSALNNTTSIAQANLPAVTLPTTVSINDPGHSHGVSGGTFGGTSSGALANGPFSAPFGATGIVINNAFTGITASGSTPLGGTNTLLPTFMSSLLITTYLKL
jgi:hypothetical protein